MQHNVMQPCKTNARFASWVTPWSCLLMSEVSSLVAAFLKCCQASYLGDLAALIAFTSRAFEDSQWI